MLIYSAEKKDGLESLLSKQHTIASLCPVFSDEKLPEETVAFLRDNEAKNLSSAIASEVESFDLHRIYTILVTVGWNLNDDVFTAAEVWNARHSPEDKPFNLSHNPRHIIGHITNCVAVDENYKVIPDDTAVEDLPSKFHLLTSAVLYKHIKSRDESLEKETKELIASIAKGDWYVSMECLFSDFDYAIATASGVQKTIARNQDSAWLTKHLRVNKGTGDIDGNKIGRSLKNITFSGKGLVENPGNPESFVFNNVEQFKGAFASVNEIIGDENMSATAPDMVSKADFALAQQEIADLRKRLEAAKETEVKEKIASVEKTVAARDEEIKSLKTELDNAKASKKEVEGSLTSAKAELDETKKKLAEAESKLEANRLEVTKANRISMLVDKGVDKAEAEKLVAAAAALSDDMFAMIVTTQAQLVEANKKLAALDKKPEEKKPDGKADAKKAEDKLDGAQADKDANLGVDTQPDTELEETVAGLSDFLSQELETKRTNKR